MTEQAPANRPVPKDERDELAKLEAQYAKKKFAVEQKEAFGGYDVNAPNRGELTYQDYHAQRPKDGIIRDELGYRNTQTGKLASEAEYVAQNGTAEDHYDEVNGFNKEAAPEVDIHDPTVLLAELARKASKADVLGDKAGYSEIEEIVMQRVLGDETLSDEDRIETLAQFESRVAYFTRKQQLEEKFANEDRNKAWAAEAPAETAETSKDDSEAPVADEAVESAAVEDDVEVAEEVSTETDSTEADDVETVESMFDASGDDAEVEKTPETPAEKAKAWWSKNSESIKEKFTMAYWSVKWQNGMDRAMNWRVTETMTEEEKEETKKKNRAIYMVGGAALAVAVLGVGGYAIFQENADAVSNGLGNGGTGGEVGSSQPTQGDGEMTKASGGGSEKADAERPIIEFDPEYDPLVERFPAESFNIPNGGGGEALMNRLGLDPSVWYANEQALLANFPNEFYQMPSGHVGISRPGMLSEGAQDFIRQMGGTV